MLKPNERLKTLRESLGLKVTAFAESIGYTHGTISQIENDSSRNVLFALSILRLVSMRIG